MRHYLEVGLVLEINGQRFVSEKKGWSLDKVY